MTDTQAVPLTVCKHVEIATMATDGGEFYAYVCRDCRIRLYPACSICVDVGHRNEHDAARSVVPDRLTMAKAIARWIIDNPDLIAAKTRENEPDWLIGPIFDRLATPPTAEEPKCRCGRAWGHPLSATPPTAEEERCGCTVEDYHFGKCEGCPHPAHGFARCEYPQ